jgi:hypothetical protein
VKARDVSLWAKILAIVIMLTGLVLKGFGVWEVAIMDVVTVAVCTTLLFSDVSLNLIVEKFFPKRD